MTIAATRRAFTADEYQRMAEAGILTEDDRVELLRGEIVEMRPIGSRHVACVNRLNRLLSGRLAARAIVSVQNPIRLGSYSEPEPDLALLRPRHDFYADALPEAADVWLVVEVMPSSSEADREVKLPLYAEAGVREAWLVDLEQERVEVYRGPTDQGYGEAKECAHGDVIAPEAFPEAPLAVAEILR